MDDLENIHLNKHVAAIHCSNNISLLQRKIFNALLFKAYHRLLLDDFHYISLSELSFLVDYNSKDTEKLKKAFKKLQSTTVEWNVIDDDKNKETEIWCSSTLLASSVIDKKHGRCRYEYSKTLAELLFQPYIYARIDLRIQNRFSSSYALALYENCIRYRNVKTTGWILLSKFKKLMGVDEKKYTKFSDFNRRVLLVAVTEINKHADIAVTVELKREAQQVAAIRFDIANKRKIIPLGVAKQDIQNVHVEFSDEVIDKLKNQFLANEQEITSLINQYDENFVKEKMQLILNSETYKKGQVRVPLALLKTALKNDFHSASKAITENKNQQNKKTPWNVKEKYKMYCVEYVFLQFDALSEAEQSIIKNQFDAYLLLQMNHNHYSYRIIYDVYRTHGVSAVSTEFVEFLVSASHELLNGMKTIDECDFK